MYDPCNSMVPFTTPVLCVLCINVHVYYNTWIMGDTLLGAWIVTFSSVKNIEFC